MLAALRTDAEKLRQAREARQLDTSERSGPGLAGSGVKTGNLDGNLDARNPCDKNPFCSKNYEFFLSSTD
jgi:hypothetical protein